MRNAVLDDPDPAELTMAVFAAEMEMTSVFTVKERRELGSAFKTLAAHFDGVVPGLCKARLVPVEQGGRRRLGQMTTDRAPRPA